MKSLFAYILYIILFLNVPYFSAQARPSKKIDLPKALKVELNSLLKDFNGLHSACTTRGTVKKNVMDSVQLVLNNIQQLKRSGVIPSSEKTHLLKILNATESYLEMVQVKKGRSYKKSLAGAFNQVVQLTRLYSLDKYRVFFCSRDRSLWLQKAWKARNPIHPRIYSRCGRQVL